MKRPGILVLEPNDWDREQIRACIEEAGVPVRILDARVLEGNKHHIDAIVLGVSDAVSIETARAQVEKARSLNPHAQLILCAPRDLEDLDTRVIELGARAFVLKPIDAETFGSLLRETVSQIELRRQRQDYARKSRKPDDISAIIGESDALRAVMGLIDRVAQSANTSVLLTGESGVGKSLFARTIHDTCEASAGPFIEINCATLPTALLESELFGYEPGAFTDARAQKIGLIELADNGTLFLDEISEVDLQTQAKLLKFLDTKRFRRLGGEVEIRVDVRIVAASNRDLVAEVRDGNFREDLFYRLNVVEIHIPPLRERPGDIEQIASYYFDFYRRKFNKPAVALAPEAVKLIHEYPWPGNVRELINVLERAVLLSQGGTIEAADLPIEHLQERRPARLGADGGTLLIDLPPEGVSLEVVEKRVIEETLRLTRGNVSRAAAMLAISRGALRNKLARHRIDPHAFHRPPALTHA